MEKILIQDNFFDNAEDLRDLALSTRFFSAEEKNYDVGWRGYRTNEMRDLDNNVLFHVREDNIESDDVEIDDTSDVEYCPNIRPGLNFCTYWKFK